MRGIGQEWARERRPKIRASAPPSDERVSERCAANYTGILNGISEARSDRLARDVRNKTEDDGIADDEDTVAGKMQNNVGVFRTGQSIGYDARKHRSREEQCHDRQSPRTPLVHASPARKRGRHPCRGGGAAPAAQGAEQTERRNCNAVLPF